MRYHVKSPKSTQKAFGCFARYSSFSPSASTSSFEQRFTSPMSVTRPSAAPSKPLAVTHSAALPALARSLVWPDMAEKQKTGSPFSSVAKPTSEPDG
eukprot:3189534-Prymnesium_polylepis.1